MDVVRKIFNRKYLFLYCFGLLLAVYLYFRNKYGYAEITYSLLYIGIGFLIALFYVFKDYLYNPLSASYKRVIMEDALFNHKGMILDDFESYPLYKEFVTFHLKRTAEDPYSDTVSAIEAVRYINHKMIDALYIPLASKDTVEKHHVMPLKEAVGKFIRYAGDQPIIIYNQPFTHTYLNVKLDKEVHISFIDAMKMSKDLYGLTGKSVKDLRKFLGFYNLGDDEVADAKVIGAIYLDYIYTVSKYRKKESHRHKLQEMLPEKLRSTPSMDPLPAKATDEASLTAAPKTEPLKENPGDSPDHHQEVANPPAEAPKVEPKSRRSKPSDLPSVENGEKPVTDLSKIVLDAWHKLRKSLKHWFDTH